MLVPSLPDALWALVGALFVVQVATIRSAPRPHVPWTVVAFLAFCASTALWSIDVGDTAASVTFYAVIALVAGTIAINARPRVMLAGLTWGAVVVSVVSVGAALLKVPGAGGDPLGEAPLMGFHGNRNIVSYVLVLGLCAALAQCAAAGPGRLRRSVGAAIVAGGVLVSTSGTGLVVSFVLVCLTVGILAVRRLSARQRRGALIGAGALAAGGGLLVLVRPDVVVAALGKDMTFSGRTPQWAAILEVSQDAWAGGYGWGAVWTYSWLPTGWSEIKLEIDEIVGYPLAHGHNLVLDVLAQAGVTGVLLMALVIGRMLWGLRHWSHAAEVVLFGWLTAAALLLNGVTEPLFTVPLGWFFVVLAATTVRQVDPTREDQTAD